MVGHLLPGWMIRRAGESASSAHIGLVNVGCRLTLQAVPESAQAANDDVPAAFQLLSQIADVNADETTPLGAGVLAPDEMMVSRSTPFGKCQKRQSKTVSSVRESSTSRLAQHPPARFAIELQGGGDAALEGAGATISGTRCCRRVPEVS
jgi:hypothetical protein